MGKNIFTRKRINWTELMIAPTAGFCFFLGFLLGGVITSTIGSIIVFVALSVPIALRSIQRIKLRNCLRKIQFRSVEIETRRYPGEAGGRHTGAVIGASWFNLTLSPSSLGRLIDIPLPSITTVVTTDEKEIEEKLRTPVSFLPNEPEQVSETSETA